MLLYKFVLMEYTKITSKYLTACYNLKIELDRPERVILTFVPFYR